MPFSSPLLFSIFSSLISSSTPVAITREQFNAFHHIDRTLFTRFVFALNRDINQTYYVIAFLLMLEQNDYAYNIVAYLIALPDPFIDAVANEIGLCLSFLYNQNLFVGIVMDDESFIPLVLRMTRGKITLGFIDQNRETFLQAVAYNLDSVCSRAFEDLRARAERYRTENLHAFERERVIEEEMRNLRLSDPEVMTTTRLRVPQETSAPHLPLPPLSPPPVIEVTTNKPSASTEVTNKPPARIEITNKPSASTEVTNKTPARIEVTNKSSASIEFTNKPFARMEITNKPSAKMETIAEEEEEEKVVAAHDRTVFLTFSKGYPISEEEVMVHFTKHFGDVIEAIIMQQVEENDQPLYARMVLKMNSASKMEEIVSGRNRHRFTINGKHVCARKYIPKNPKSASSSHYRV